MRLCLIRSKIVFATSKGYFPDVQKREGLLMNEFLLLAVIIIYLAISYMPGNRHGGANDRPSDRTIERDGW